MKRIIKLLFAVATVLFVATNVPQEPVLAVSFIGISLFAVAGLIIPNSYLQTNTLGALDVTVWKKYIVEKLRKANAFIFASKDDSTYVLGGLTVVIPNSGADPTITLNNTSWPLTAATRTDNEVTYTLDSFSTTPHHIPWSEIQTLSYDKLDSIIGAHSAALVDAIADKMLINWAPTTSGAQIATTGGPTALETLPISGQSLNRLALHPKDLLKAMSAFNQANVPDMGRKCVIDAAMYEDFYSALTDSQANAYNQFADNKTGQVGKLHSFDIFVRSSVVKYASAGTSPKAYGTSVASTDNLASLCWHESMVCRAIGEMKPFMDKDNPLYQGDIFSMIVRAGGRKERYDGVGVIALVQAAV